MPKPATEVKTSVSLLAAVSTASCLAAWTMRLEPDAIGLVLIIVFFFRFVPMVAAAGALFGRPTFGVALGIATLFALLGIGIANTLIASV